MSKYKFVNLICKEITIDYDIWDSIAKKRNIKVNINLISNTVNLMMLKEFFRQKSKFKR